MKLLFELSGEHPTLPLAELECVGTVIDHRTQVALADCSSPATARRLSLTHAVLEYLGDCKATEEAIVELLQTLQITSPETFSVRVKKIHGSNLHMSQLYLERLIGTSIKGTVNLDRPGREFRAIISGDRCFFGRLLFTIDRGSFNYRNPLRRPFFHPGVILPRMARAMVNLSLISPGELMIDPFCGTGGLLLEANLIGVMSVGGDADEVMIRGSRRNIPEVDVLRENAIQMPFKSSTADAIVTDLPYGQSVSLKATGLEDLYLGSIAEIHRILKPNRRAVIITHKDIRDLAHDNFELVQFHEQRVHKSLTRRIMVLKK